jgi:anti-anti-sigma factor
MERHLTTSTVGSGTPSERLAAASAGGSNRRFDKNTGSGAWQEPGLVLRSVRSWTHTLVLTGELTHSSASALELAMERLCEEGVTDITLDLRRLTHIDATGVAVIAFRCGLCERQGYGCQLIPGPRSIQRAFERAGAIDSLPFQEDELAARRPLVSISAQRLRDGCEQ